MKHKVLQFLFTALVCICSGSCKKLLDIPTPTDVLTEDVILKDDLLTVGLINRVFSMAGSNQNLFFGNSGLSFTTGLSADEIEPIALTNSSLSNTYLNTLQSTQNAQYGTYFYSEAYGHLNYINRILEIIKQPNELTARTVSILEGETRFLRAFYYFYLTNLYGELPLATTSKYYELSGLRRSPVDSVYALIQSDLKKADELLEDDYLTAKYSKYSSNAERVRPNKSTAKAMLSKVNLYLENWTDAERYASDVISNPLYDTVPVQNAFLKNNNEAIWQVPFEGWGTNNNNSEADVFRVRIKRLWPTNQYYIQNVTFLSNSLSSAFEAGDKRRSAWIDTVARPEYTRELAFFNKYTNDYNDQKTEYLTYIRLSEIYLIRAEARAHLADITGALSDLNVIRKKAGLADATASSVPELLDAIAHERRVELFGEMGNRWFDLKRTKKIDEVMTAEAIVKGTTWKMTAQLFPLPFNDVTKFLTITQNPGY